LCELGLLGSEDPETFVNARLLEGDLRVESAITAASQEIPLSQISCSSYAAPELDVLQAVTLIQPTTATSTSPIVLRAPAGIALPADAGTPLPPAHAVAEKEGIPDLFLSPSPRSENFIRGRWGEPTFNPEGSKPPRTQRRNNQKPNSSVMITEKPKGPRPPPKERHPLPAKNKKNMNKNMMQQLLKGGGSGKRLFRIAATAGDQSATLNEMLRK
jgi:hypothetical protein